MNLTVLIEAKYIPDGSRVSKATGENVYNLRAELKIYSQSGEPQIIKSSGCKFLVSDTGVINSISETLILKWYTDLDELNYMNEETDK